MFNKKIPILMSLSLFSIFLGCNDNDSGKFSTKDAQQAVSTEQEKKASPIPTATPTPYPEDYHPGYGNKLPEGAIYQDKKIIYTAPEPTYISHIAYKFLDYTNYYTVPGMTEELVKLNKTNSAYIGKGQKIIINNVREKAPAPKTIAKPKDFEAKGVYITHTVAGSGYIFQIVKDLKRLGLNTVVIDAKDMDGILSYKSAIPLAKEIGASKENPPIRDLKKLVEMLHNDGIHVVMRQTLFHDEILAHKKPEFVPVSKKSGKPWKEVDKQVWVDPSRKEVQELF